jgi:hypothetical protein
VTAQLTLSNCRRTTTRLPPFFNWFSSKNKLAQYYPAPKHGKLVESHCGGAGYACNNHELDVLLCDVDPRVTTVWQYLINASQHDILSLPLLRVGQSIDEFALAPEERLFLSCCVNTSPFRRTLTSWQNGQNTGLWGEVKRARVAANIEFIRHWRVIYASYDKLPNERATWFVDPLYRGMEHHFAISRKHPTDYSHLAEWCRYRNGQVIVCERASATWLPFRPLGSSAVQGGLLTQHRGTCTEGVWTADNEPTTYEPERVARQLGLFGNADIAAE